VASLEALVASLVEPEPCQEVLAADPVEPEACQEVLEVDLAEQVAYLEVQVAYLAEQAAYLAVQAAFQAELEAFLVVLVACLVALVVRSGFLRSFLDLLHLPRGGIFLHHCLAYNHCAKILTSILPVMG